MKYLMIIVVLITFNCSRPDSANKVLHQNGYTDIEITGWKFFGCDGNDFFSTGFKAKSPIGFPVSGNVCEGWFKGATIRLK